MKKQIFSIMILIMSMVLVSCSDVIDSNNSDSADQSGDWLIPVDQVFDGGPGKDGIPAITSPAFIAAANATYLSNSDLVILVKEGFTVRAYPHPILDWHEIINDDLTTVSVAVTYCPLTGSAIGWNRMIEGEKTTFGVSGLLYNTNLIPYDRKTNSNWSQMKMQCVNGSLSGDGADLVHLIETTFETAKELYPNVQVVSTNTGFNRNYGVYPYGDYKTNNSKLLFPISNTDSRLGQKERVLGLSWVNQARAFPLKSFDTVTTVINETMASRPYVVIGDKTKNFATAYERTIGGSVLTFTALENQLPNVMIDDEGTTWNIFGEGVSGPRTGESLTPARGYIAYWFAWATFYPQITIY